MISGLVVRLTHEKLLANAAIELISTVPAIEIGQRLATDLPIVLETETPAESRDLTEWLAAVPGVAHVDVTFTCFDDEFDDTPDSELAKNTTSRTSGNEKEDVDDE